MVGLLVAEQKEDIEKMRIVKPEHKKVRKARKKLART